MYKSLLFSVLFFISIMTIQAQWEQITNTGLTTKTFSIIFPDSLNGYIGDDYGKVAKTTNGGNTWTILETGINTALRYGFFIDNNTGYFTGSNGKIIKTSTGGDSWVSQTTNTSNLLVAIHFPTRTTGYAVGDASTLLKTTNGGDTWITLNNFPFTDFRSVFFIDSLTGWASGFYGVLIKTTDGGDSWSSYPGFPVQSIRAICFPSKEIGYIAGNWGLMYKTTNKGNTWLQLYPPTGAVLNYLFFFNDNIGYTVGIEGAILKTTDGGSTWFNQNSNTFLDIYSIAFANENKGFCVGGVPGQSLVLQTLNGGGEPTPVELISFNAICSARNIILNWSTATEKNNKGFRLLRKSLSDQWKEIAFVEGKGTTTSPSDYVYTDYPNTNGTYFYKLEQIDFNGTNSFSNVAEVDFQAQITFQLEQNYPNPFNPSTKIRYYLPYSGNVSLKIYDALGKLNNELINEHQEQGAHEIIFNSNELNIPSGVYFYELNSGNIHEVKKMVLLK